MISDAPHRVPAHDDHDDFGGLRRDAAFLGRRRLLQLIGGAGLVGIVAACSGSDDESVGTVATDTGGADTSAATTAAADTAAPTVADTAAPTVATDAAAVEASAGTEIPDETQGPYPADGSNGPNLLTDGAVVRSDITQSIGDLSGTADGVPTTINLTVVDAATGSALAGHAVYLWHCTAGGAYSIYEVTDQNYLRGVQETDAAGRLSFQTVFPGCYNGRWPHAHFEVFSSLDEANAGSSAIKTSQLALPEADCATVYADSRYGASGDNLSRQSLDTDNVFADGWTEQLATVAGSVDAGYTVSLLVRV